MSLRLNPRSKLFLLSGLLVVLIVAGSMKGADTVSLARLLLGGGALAGLAIWLKQQKRTPKTFEAPRLQVSAKASLSPRCSVALVRADGRSYLVAFGDGFAQIHASTELPAKARRSGGRSKARKISLSNGGSR